MKDIIFKGCGTAIATPFDENGINFEEFNKLLEFQISNDVNSIIVCGTTGESATMSLQEKKDLISFTVKKVNGRIPVIAGTGSNNTNDVINLSKYAEQAGVNALLIVTPYYNKTTQNGLIKHYYEISKNVSLPIILYNVPSRTGLNIEPSTCLELSKINNIVAIKEASGNIAQIAKISALCRNNLHIYSGNDDQIIPILSLGGLGVISVLSNIAPKITSDICKNYFNGNIDKSLNLQLDYLPLINSLFSEVNPIPVKYALNLLGFDFKTPRLPLVELSDTNKSKLKKCMEDLKII